MNKSLINKNMSSYESMVMNLKENRLKTCFRLISAHTPGRLLDVACGAGDFSGLLIRAGWDVYGVEGVNEQVNRAKERGVKAYQCDLSENRLPFEDDFFDFIFAGEIIEHLIDTDGFLESLRRVLKPGGNLIITTPNLASFENRGRILFGKYPEWMDYCLSEGCGHVRAYTPQVLKKQLTVHKFSISAQTGDYVPLLPRKWRIKLEGNFILSIMDKFAFVFPNLTSGIIIMATKV